MSVERQVIAIVGPTASGKSELAMRLAVEVGGEILSCDSVQVYRGFEIGCAKPDARERARVPHHLLDLVEWHEPFDAQRYRELCLRAIEEVQARGHLPIICGGTGLYLRAVRFGLVPVPPADPALRQALYAEEKATPGVLYARLAREDPAAAARIEPRNLVYVVRALEISALTGEPASVVRARHGFARPEVPMRVLGLGWPHDLLRERVMQRSRAMLDGGLVAEVERLLAAGVSAEARPMRSVGYQETCDVLRGLAPREGLFERIAQSTAAYAKRQRTWFRRESGLEWIECTSIDAAWDRLCALNLDASRAMPG